MVEKDNIGELIKQKLKENGQSISWLAKQVNCDRCNLSKILNGDDINSKLLENISRVLKHNFFVYLHNKVKESIKK